MLRIVSLLCLAAFLSAGSGAQVVKGRYYDLHYSGGDADDLVRMLDALYERLQAYFGRAPEGRLTVKLYETEKEYLDSLVADRQIRAGGGGYYAPSNKTAYLFRQPSEHWTRHLILHEATHQFHYLVATGNRGTSASWYTEGLAEAFAMHNWDGSRLQTAVIPAVSLEDYPAHAFQIWQELNWDVEGLATGKKTAARPAGWSLVAFLREKYPAGFKALAAALDSRGDPAKAWADTFGSRPGLAAELRAWIEAHQQPWKIQWVAWTAKGDWLEGRSGVVSVTTLKERPKELQVDLDLRSGAMKAGVVFGFRSTSDFQMAQLWPDGKLHVIKREGGKWTEHRVIDVAEGKGMPNFLMRIGKGRIDLSVNGKSVGVYDADGDVGLTVDGCTARFRPRIKR